MKKLLTAVAALLLAGLSLALPASPASATGVTTAWSGVANGQHLAFAVTDDVVQFDDATVKGADVRLAEVGPNLAVTLGAKTAYLDGVQLAALRIEAFSFASGSRIVVGDGYASTSGDRYGLTSFGSLGSDPGTQVISLGGGNVYSGGNNADRMVGAPVSRSLLHVSRTADQAAPTGTSNPSVSLDGNLVAFDGGWTGFGSVNNNATDVIVRNVATGTFTDEHKTWSGAAGSSGSGQVQISSDGNFVVFTSSSQLVPISTPSNSIFRADTRNGDVVLVSAAANGVPANSYSANPDISADGRYVVFSSAATNLATGSAGTGMDVFVKDLQTGAIDRISTSQSGGDANADAITPRISDEYQTVVFTSAATNLVDTETGGGATDVYMWDGSGHKLYDMSAGGTGTGSSRNPDIGEMSGGFGVTFESDKQLSPSDTNATTDVYAGRDIPPTLQLVSSTGAGTGVVPASTEPAISSNGRFVAFRSYSDALVPGDTNGYSDVFVKDLRTGVIALVSRTVAAQANQQSSHPDISADGASVVFETAASNLDDLDANSGLQDVFLTGNPLMGGDLRGGAGNDTYDLDGRMNDKVTELPAGGTDTVEARVAGTYTLPSEVENFIGTSGVDVVHGNASANRIDPGLGNDVMWGSAGNDTYLANAATDVITGETSTGGTDTVASAVTWTLGAFLENLTLTGSAAINGTGNTVNNVLTGNSANNVLSGGAGADTYVGGGGADQFSIDTSATVDTVNDFTVGTDKFRMKQSAWHIGDGDLLVEGATNRTGPGGFSKSAEYVVISKNLTSITTANAAAAIGSATSSYATGNRRIFVVDNGTSSQAMLFISSGNDAKVTAAELKPLMTFKNRNAMSVSSLLFTA